MYNEAVDLWNRKATMSSRSLLIFNLIFAAALVLRLWDLDLKPLHHDEGVNGWFLINLFENGYYRYDPANYHGPFLYYTILIAFKFLGVNDFALRLMPALFGAATILPLLWVRRRLGEGGVLFAAALLALSPTHAFFAREAIHETFFIFFTLLVYVLGVRWLAEGRRGAVAGTLVAVACLASVKETWILTVGALLLALLLTYPGKCFGTLLRPLSRKYLREEVARKIEASGSYRWRNLFPWRWTVAGGLLAMLVLILYYSSFFTYARGVLGPLEALRFWAATGHAGAGHEKPFLYYIGALFRSEPHLLAAALPAFVAAFVWRSRPAAYLVVWFLIMILGYSMIPYKTPWLLVNFTLPLTLLGGWFLGRLVERYQLRFERAALTTGALVLFVTQASASIDLNFRHYDDEERDQVYVHTRREIYGMIERLETIAAKWPAGHSTIIQVTSPEYWPLTWYLRDFDRVTYHGGTLDQPDGEIIIASRRDEATTTRTLTVPYQREYYDLRAGAPLVVYYRTDLWEEVFGAGGPAASTSVAVDPETLEPGVRMSVFPGREAVGEAVETRVEERMGFWWEDVEKKPYQAPFSITYEGYLRVERPGLHLFITNSDDGSILYIDGELVVDNDGDHALRYASGSMHLEEGYHAFYLRYFDSGWGAILEVKWRPAEGEEESIPSTALFHEPD